MECGGSTPLSNLSQQIEELVSGKFLKSDRKCRERGRPRPHR
jgi:hypothetical protein